MEIDETKETAPEPGWHKRSPLWAREAEIRELLAKGCSYRQIVRMLRLGITRQSLSEWCRRAGLQSHAPSRHRQAAEKPPASRQAPPVAAKEVRFDFGSDTDEEF